MGTPLHLAVFSGHADCCRVLLEFGASPRAKDSFGLSPLDLAEDGGSAPCIQLLRKYDTGEPS